ncbi:hypothetical protein VTK73DRAFT_8465 [Phialemonium thermophilum]|uniref:Uncharacterized protein n=1 Tax=Phialemonium thermophilum TaxID=223376 RepID=A0ABR3W8G8_9PEZI
MSGRTLSGEAVKTVAAPHGAQHVPVTGELLGVTTAQGLDEDALLLSRFPASYLDDHFDLAPMGLDSTCVQRELDLERLDGLFDWLWLAGRPYPPRPLHRQVFLGREIVAVEQMDLHLLWTKGRIFVKPLPPFLLDPAFWPRFACDTNDACDPDVDRCRRGRIWRAALGFLFSYASLIRHESDLGVAKERRLVPSTVEWAPWSRFCRRLLQTESLYQKMHRRFLYGELRLGRLDKISLVARPPSIQGYLPRWNRYDDFLKDNLAWLVSAAAVIGIALGAMQVGLATTHLQSNATFQAVSYSLTVFSMVAPLAVIGLIVAVAWCLFLVNWLVAVARYKARFRIFRRQDAVG